MARDNAFHRLWATAARERELDHIRQALANTHGVLLAGAWGVGKSGLLGAALDQAAAEGARTVAVSGAIPTGTAGSLAECLEDRIGGDIDRQRPPLVLGLDDAHLTDPVAAASLYALVRGGRVRLVAAAESGAALPSGLSRLWVERLADRLEVRHFHRTGALKVLQARLGGQLSVDCLERLWSATGGNATLLRELSDAGFADGALHEEDGIWQWRGELPVDPSGRLGALVQLRLAGLRLDERELLQLVSLAEPLEADLATAAGLGSAAESLNRSGLVVTERSGGRLRLRLVYGLYSAAVLRALPELAGRRLRRQLADAIEATGMNRHNDVPRVVALRLDAGQTPCPGHLLTAAETALRLHDFERAEELARRALSVTRTSDLATRARIVLGQAFEGRGRHPEAERVLAEVPAPDPARTGELLAVRAVNMAYGLGRLPEAIGVVDRALQETGRPGRLPLTGARSLLGLLDDRFAEVVAAGDAPAQGSASLTGLVTVPAAFARVELGDPQTALARVRSLEAGEHHRFVGAAAQWVDSYALLHTAGVAEAVARVASMRWWDEGDPRERVRIALLRSRLHRASGDWSAAVDELRRAGALEGPQDWLTAHSWTLAQLAAALAEAGEHAEAVRTLVEVRAVQARTVRYPLARDGAALEAAVVSAHVGDRPRAIREAVAVATTAGAAGRWAQAVSALHLAARLGAAGEAAALLPDPAGLSGTTAVQARHVQALARWDGGALDALAESQAWLGFLPLAAETAAQSALAHQAAGNHRRSRAARAACRDYLGAFGGTLPPWVKGEDLRSCDTFGTLTVREREVSALVAAGLTNQEVADQLSVSVRTVENHLHRTYGKLGITTRSELAGRLDRRAHNHQDVRVAPAGLHR
ncbi:MULTISPECIES: helix-turn-helix transcriptional regulator [Streptomyces]|uniref:helix-turn-helix transcriptional regulator n=1 Tax=Streptomyces TaxID=1883 RepID=UPI0006EB5756|nr:MULTISPECIES: helix-turn-helix transcriptional regulator [Streptomyces]